MLSYDYIISLFMANDLAERSFSASKESRITLEWPEGKINWTAFLS